MCLPRAAVEIHQAPSTCSCWSLSLGASRPSPEPAARPLPRPHPRRHQAGGRHARRWRHHLEEGHRHRGARQPPPWPGPASMELPADPSMRASSSPVSASGQSCGCMARRGAGLFTAQVPGAVPLPPTFATPPPPPPRCSPRTRCSVPSSPTAASPRPRSWREWLLVARAARSGVGQGRGRLRRRGPVQAGTPAGGAWQPPSCCCCQVKCSCCSGRCPAAWLAALQPHRAAAPAVQAGAERPAEPAGEERRDPVQAGAERAAVHGG